MKDKVDKLVGVEDVMKETCLAVDKLVDPERCLIKYEQTLMSSESQKLGKSKGLFNLFYDKNGPF